MRDVTKFPHATGKVRYSNSAGDALKNACEHALTEFEAKYNRKPELDILCFRGFFTTTDAVFEIWEEA